MKRLSALLRIVIHFFLIYKLRKRILWFIFVSTFSAISLLLPCLLLHFPLRSLSLFTHPFFHQYSDDLSFQGSGFVFFFSSFSFRPSPAPFMFLIHSSTPFPSTLRWSRLYGRPFTCTRLHLLWLPPLSHLLYYHCSFPLCLVPPGRCAVSNTS